MMRMNARAKTPTARENVSIGTVTYHSEEQNPDSGSKRHWLTMTSTAGRGHHFYKAGHPIPALQADRATGKGGACALPRLFQRGIFCVKRLQGS